MSKKGLSPVIASVLLVALVLVLATIIFLWARAFIPETIEKDGVTIESKCAEIGFSASLSSTRDLITIQNTANVPISGIRYGVERTGSLAYYDKTAIAAIVAGGSASFSGLSDKPAENEHMRVIPVLLGKTSSGELKSFVCEENAITI